ncbi:MAG: PDR/VanB family oxidoreductase [Pseudomonadota bacterium]
MDADELIRPPAAAVRRTDLIQLVVDARRRVAEDVVLLSLVRTDGQPLPRWTPGAHIDVFVDGSAHVRQYSLCGDPRDDGRWDIAVLREPNGRGGSAAIHEKCFEGTTVWASPPVNHFPLREAGHVVLIAGGIGITPFLPMIGALERAGRSWELHYAGRKPDSMAFAAELDLWHGSRVRLYPKSVGRPLALANVLHRLPPGAAIYACGPTRLLQEVDNRCSAAGVKPHMERFAAPARPEPDVGDEPESPFEVHLARTGVTILVEPGQSILDAAEAAGADVFGSCLEGVCGTCETRVLEGAPDHRDCVLEGSPTDTMMICVSRCKGSRLILDV